MQIKYMPESMCSIRAGTVLHGNFPLTASFFSSKCNFILLSPVSVPADPNETGRPVPFPHIVRSVFNLIIPIHLVMSSERSQGAADLTLPPL